MSIPGAGNPLLLGGAGGYEIERSLRFNSSDSAYCSRSVSSAGNRKKWTYSLWVKRSALGVDQHIFSAGVSGVADDGLHFDPSDRLSAYTYRGSLTSSLVTTQVFRDCSAWYHILWAWDADNATAAQRSRLYVNGVEVTAFSTSSYPASGTSSDINNNVEHSIGDNRPNFTSGNFSGYLADIHFIDGQALDPTSFGEFDDNGIWQPIRYTGSYGTNGFHLDFSDNSSAAALGYDAAGSNDWTVNNLSVTAGAGNDSLVDVPTNGSETDTGVGGEVRGNYCTWNALRRSSSTTLSNGNLDASSPATNEDKVLGTLAIPSTGSWYFEITIGSPNLGYIGIGSQAIDIVNGNMVKSYGYNEGGRYYIDGSYTPSVFATFTSGDVIGVKVANNASLTFYKNGAQTSTTKTIDSSYIYFPMVNQYDMAVSANFGQRPWAYPANASGSKALCTTNLPDPTIADGSTAMDVKLYTGNGSTQTISGLGFSPDFVWIKGRASAYSHMLYDAVRGVNRDLRTDTTNAENVASPAEFTAFTSDGFTVETNGSQQYVNFLNQTYVAWTWDAGSSTVTNNDGSISSQVRANASAGFSIVTYTGNGVGGATVGHGLGVAPVFIILKRRDSSQNWVVYTSVVDGSWDYLFLNLTNTKGDAAEAAPTSSVFSISSGPDMNANGSPHLGYCFAPVAGYSAFGSYTGNGSADGSFVYLGFRPAVVLVKMSSSTGNWTMLDYKREGYNVDNDPLYPNLSNAEGTTDLIDITSNGFKVRTTDASVNTNAGTYIYAAWAESPFALARAR